MQTKKQKKWMNAMMWLWLYVVYRLFWRLYFETKFFFNFWIFSVFFFAFYCLFIVFLSFWYCFLLFFFSLSYSFVHVFYKMKQKNLIDFVESWCCDESLVWNIFSFSFEKEKQLTLNYAKKELFSNQTIWAISFILSICVKPSPFSITEPWPNSTD